MSFSDDRLYYAATSRNRDAILSVLQRTIRLLSLPQARVLEVASGSGEHATYLAPKLANAFPNLIWQPSDLESKCVASINAWRESMSANHQKLIRPATTLDVSCQPWPWSEGEFNVLVNINMIHISPWQCCEDLMREAGRIIPRPGLLYLYGPFMRNGQHTAPSNVAFSEQLRRQNPQWGVRNLEDVAELAKQAQFELSDVVEMPANNLSVVFVRP